MKTSLLRVTGAVLGIILLLAVLPGIGEDYLIIKKKDGSTQKVPLKFAPDQIDSFDVEAAPGEEGARQRVAPPGGPEREKPGAVEESEEGAPEKQPAPPSRPTRPGAPPSGPSILEKEPKAPSPFAPGPRQPAGREVVPKQRPARETQQPQYGVEQPAGPARQLPRGPVAATVPGGKGTFSVNVYKLPENVRALPDYTAFKPQSSITADKIDLEPAKGQNEPAGLPQDSDGLGMRAMGMFLVAGEGIFKWRLYSKDGARLHVDDKTLIENDGIHEPSSKMGFLHLAEGVHSIVLDSFNAKGTPVLKLSVQPPVGPEQVFSIGDGLAGWKEPEKPYDVLWGQVYFVPKGHYPTGPDFSRLSPIGRIIATDLSVAGGEGFPGLPGRKDMVGIRYQGFFNVTGAGVFAFRLASDHFARLVIGKDTVAEITEGAKSGTQGKLGWAFLQQGSYPIAVDYFHPEGQPLLQLYVTEPEGQEQLFAPARPLNGFSPEGGKLSLIPAFVYFLKPGTNKLPNFNKMSPSGMFFTRAIDYPVDRGSREFPGVPKRDQWLGLRFYVKFTLSENEAGTYKFRIVCDDAARLIVGKKMVINVESFGRTAEKSGSVDMQPGSHEMFLDYFQATGPDGLQLFITPPGGEEKVFAFN